jgi:hypothetical protein
MSTEKSECPFHVGDRVVFAPSKRTVGHYQNIEGFGVKVGQSYVIKEIREGMYLYFESGAGGWPWSEFS